MRIAKSLAEKLAFLYGITPDTVEDIACGCSDLTELRPELTKIFGEPLNAEEHQPSLVRSTDTGRTYRNGKERAGGE